MIKEIVFATNNEHKLKEIREIIGDQFHILSLEDIGCNQEIIENGTTLKDNALIKARFIKDNFGYDCFADDTGLEIDALDGAPGVYSARFAGKDCNSENNINKVLILLGNCANRNARFATEFALIIGNKIKFFTGEVKGHIATERHGVDGFGYDPIFYPENSTLTFAEMSAEDKNEISHRGLATKKLIDYLKSIE